MAISMQKHYLDLVSGIRAPITIHVSQGDFGQQINLNILENGVSRKFTTESVVIHGTRFDGGNFGPLACSYVDDVVSFIIDSSMTAVAGPAMSELSITDASGNKLGTANFTILVETSVFPNGVTYDTDPSVYEAILKFSQTSQASTISNAVGTSKSYTDGKIGVVESKIAAEAATRLENDTALSNRISNLVVSAGGSSITEVVDARAPFSGSAKTVLKDRLNLFLEYSIKSTTEDING